jgi:hypothetical protein
MVWGVINIGTMTVTEVLLLKQWIKEVIIVDALHKMVAMRMNMLRKSTKVGLRH